MTHNKDFYLYHMFFANKEISYRLAQIYELKGQNQYGDTQNLN